MHLVRITNHFVVFDHKGCMELDSFSFEEGVICSVIKPKRGSLTEPHSIMCLMATKSPERPSGEEHHLFTSRTPKLEAKRLQNELKMCSICAVILQ